MTGARRSRRRPASKAEGLREQPLNRLGGTCHLGGGARKRLALGDTTLQLPPLVFCQSPGRSPRRRRRQDFSNVAACNPTKVACRLRCPALPSIAGTRRSIPILHTPYVINWTIGYQREIWSERDRSPLRRQSRQQPVAQLQHQRDEHHREWLPRRVPERAAQSRHQPRQRPHRLRQPGAAGPGRAPALRHGFRAARLGPRGGSGEPATRNGNVRHAAAAGPGRTACEHARRRLPLPVSHGRQRACQGARHRGYNASAPYPINIFQTNPYGAGSQMRQLTDEASSKYDALQLQFRKRYQPAVSA